MNIILLNVLGILVAGALLSAAGILLFKKSKKATAKIVKTVETEEEIVSIFDNGEEFHYKKDI